MRALPDDRRLITLDGRERRGLFDRRGEDRDLRRAGMCLPMRCTKKVSPYENRYNTEVEVDNTVFGISTFLLYFNRATPFVHRTRVGCRRTPCHARAIVRVTARKSVSRVVSRIISCKPVCDVPPFISRQS